MFELKSYPMIKCNISPKDGEKIYHLPMDQQYDRVVIGDRRVRGFVSGDLDDLAGGLRQDPEDRSHRRLSAGPASGAWIALPDSIGLDCISRAPYASTPPCCLGNVTRNAVPTPGVDCASIDPPCASISFFEIASPRPVPLLFEV